MEHGKPNGAPELLHAGLDFANAWLTNRGTLYYYTTGISSNIFGVNLGSDMKISQAPRLIAERFVNANNGPAPSPDGSQLTYLSLRQTGNVVVIRNLKSGEETEVPAKVPVAMVRSQGPLWFPDGRSLLLLSREPNKAGAGLYRINISTGNADLVVRLLQPLRGYRLAPDGKALFYAEQSAETSPKALTTRLVRFDLETQRETELKSGELIQGLAVSADSKWIAYLSSGKGPGEKPYIAVMPASGGEGKEVFRAESWPDNSAVNSMLAWSPDQSSVLFVKGHELWRVRVSDGKPELMFTWSGTIRSPQFHPDGKTLFFAGFDTRGGGVWTLENFLPAEK
jgi:Tol biopolymer transport system component